jgi:hypothetical protein
MGGTGKTHYCQIIDRTSPDLCGKHDGVCVRVKGHPDGCSNPAPAGEYTPARFYRGQGSSYRVAAQRAIAKLVEDNGNPFSTEVSIKTGRVG